MPRIGERKRISRRLIVHIIAFSSAITLCLSAVQLGLEYLTLRDALDQELESVSIYVPSIAGSLWDFDEKQLVRALDGLILLPNVTQASIAATGTQDRWSAGAQGDGTVVTRTYSLRHVVRGEDTEIGRLAVVASLRGIHRQVFVSAATILLSNGLKTLLVVLFMVVLFRRVVTSRLERLASKVDALVPALLPLRQAIEADPEPMPGALDELDAVDWTLERTTKALGVAVGALAKLNGELEARVEERTKELESFSYSVSHDLRTPLRAIDGFARILTEDYDDKLDDEGRRLLASVRNNATRMGQLIDDIIEFSRMGRREMGAGRVDMQHLVESVFADLWPLVSDRDVQLKVGPLPPARADGAMIRQVLDNLLSNAIKFTRERERARIEVSAEPGATECTYCIRDNGAGFDMQYVDKLFRVFERLHRADEFEGTGIGLAIVKRIIGRHGGRVWAEGKLCEGAAIYFTLPLAETAPAPVE